MNLFPGVASPMVRAKAPLHFFTFNPGLKPGVSGSHHNILFSTHIFFGLKPGLINIMNNI